MTSSVAVVGAGPAGLMAATAAARAGAVVHLFDEGATPGGQLLYRAQIVTIGSGEVAERPADLLRRLLSEATAAGVELHLGAAVVGCFAGNELLVIENGTASHLTPDILIVTTGSTDLPYPFPGATLPGVFSARALQILMHQLRVRPGRRFAVIGANAGAEELAIDIALAGGEVVWSGIAPPQLLSAEGAPGVQCLIVGQARYDVDIVVIAVGRQPDSALATMAGVPIGFTPALGGLVPVVDNQMRSPVPQLLIAGDAAGTGSIAAALAEGHLAGMSAAGLLGLASEDEIAAARIAGGPGLAARFAMRAILPAKFAQPYA